MQWSLLFWSKLKTNEKQMEHKIRYSHAAIIMFFMFFIFSISNFLQGAQVLRAPISPPLTKL